MQRTVTEVEWMAATGQRRAVELQRTADASAVQAQQRKRAAGQLESPMRVEAIGRDARQLTCGEPDLRRRGPVQVDRVIEEAPVRDQRSPQLRGFEVESPGDSQADEHRRTRLARRGACQQVVQRVCRQLTLAAPAGPAGHRPAAAPPHGTTSQHGLP
jgi:hypothetical protein